MENPFTLFSQWFEEAKNHPSITDATMMSLATATKEAMPSVRIVLMKGFDDRGFTFYTNMESRKSLELKQNPYAALCFYWQPLGRQVRIEGIVEQVSDEEADQYFASRPLVSRIGALISEQSRPLESHGVLMQKVADAQRIYSEMSPPPRPDRWSGWRVVPSLIEFWKEGDFRLHDRTLYTRLGNHWTQQKLYP
ncbi:MAG TPA: pyridoxamine 5'-phosphate oxidase [Rickettsiales bacterium]|nr:pyridoxamine 5'-phosphate oxidase [Rickettsiales bacterium]